MRPDETVGQWKNVPNNTQTESEQGRTVNVERAWTRDDKDEWSEACQWIGDQYQRLRAILASYDDQGEDEHKSA